MVLLIRNRALEKYNTDTIPQRDVIRIVYWKLWVYIGTLCVPRRRASIHAFPRGAWEREKCVACVGVRKMCGVRGNEISMHTRNIRGCYDG